MTKLPQKNLPEPCPPPNVSKTPSTSPIIKMAGTIATVDSRLVYHAKSIVEPFTTGRVFLMTMLWKAVVHDERIPNVTPILLISYVCDDGDGETGMGNLEIGKGSRRSIVGIPIWAGRRGQSRRIGQNDCMPRSRIMRECGTGLPSDAEKGILPVAL